MRLAITTLSLALAAAVYAAPATAASFEQDGAHYEYSRVDQPGGAVLIDGRAVEDGTSFSLRVIADHVTGKVDGKPIAFTISQQTMAKLLGDKSAAIASK